MREVVTEDIARLTELPFMRISRYDRDKALENIAALEDRMEQVKHNLENLVDYAINYFQNIQKKYGKDKDKVYYGEYTLRHWINLILKKILFCLIIKDILFGIKIKQKN